MDGEAATAGVLAFGEHRGTATLRERATGRNVLAVLTETTSDEWYRQWERGAGTVDRLGLLECYEFARGGATRADDRVAGSGGLSFSTVERPVGPERLSGAVDRHLEEWAIDDGEVLLYLESLDDLVADAGSAAAVETVKSLGSRHGVAELVVGVAPQPTAARTVVKLQGLLTETVGAPEPDSEALTAVTRLREADPTTFGYFARYWREAVRALEAADRTYPRAKQLRESVDAELSARMLGAALSGFVWLDVITLRGETNGPNRYDCRAYDPERAARLGLAAESLAD